MQNNDLSPNILQQKSLLSRINILKSIHKAGKGHIGGAYSIVDILVSLYYGNHFKHNPNDPKCKERDRFILSKGHAGIALYSILSDLGYFSTIELDFLNQGGLLAEHPDPRIPGVEFMTGSLGHGLPIATGMALADLIDGSNKKSIVLLGDGECYEGSVWESAIFASSQSLYNLCAVVDRNGLITHGTTEEINPLEPFFHKWQSFGWLVKEVDAHSFEDLTSVWDEFYSTTKGSPTLILANSIKGKGVSFMENQSKWHHGAITDDIYELAYSELNRSQN